MKEELGYICPQTKKQCDDECCVSAEDCHAEAINSIISNCEPEQLNQNKMTIQKWLSNVKYDEFGGTYIWNIDENGGSDMVATVRGWGTVQHEFATEKEAGKFQDEVGEFIAQAIREKIERDFKSE